jgi:pimeloyl-ACP methyl ester carboxylesterase
MTTATVQTEGAEICFDYEGAGPLLLLIAGAGGSGQRYAPVSTLLKDEYTVVCYDRRCNARSTGDPTRDADIAQQARDAAAVIKAMDAKQALVFGSSSGANIGLKLVEDMPELIAGLVAHEPPVLWVLPDAQQWFIFGDEAEAIFKARGFGPALGRFASTLVGVTPPSPPPPGSEAARAAEVSWNFFFAHEIHNLSRYAPDLQHIKHGKVPMFAVSGRDSKDAYYARTAKIISEVIGCPHRVISSHHLAFVADPATFASELRAMLRELQGVSSP